MKYPVYSTLYTELYNWDENHVTEGPAIHQQAPCHYFLDGDMRNTELWLQSCFPVFLIISSRLQSQ